MYAAGKNPLVNLNDPRWGDKSGKGAREIVESNPLPSALDQRVWWYLKDRKATRDSELAPDVPPNAPDPTGSESGKPPILDPTGKRAAAKEADGQPTILEPTKQAVEDVLNNYYSQTSTFVDALNEGGVEAVIVALDKERDKQFANGNPSTETRAAIVARFDEIKSEIAKLSEQTKDTESTEGTTSPDAQPDVAPVSKDPKRRNLDVQIKVLTDSLAVEESESEKEQIKIEIADAKAKLAELPPETPAVAAPTGSRTIGHLSPSEYVELARQADPAHTDSNKALLDEHKQVIEESVRLGNEGKQVKVNAAAAKQYAITTPEGWTQEGDFIVPPVAEDTAETETVEQLLIAQDQLQEAIDKGGSNTDQSVQDDLNEVTRDLDKATLGVGTKGPEPTPAQSLARNLAEKDPNGLGTALEKNPELFKPIEKQTFGEQQGRICCSQAGEGGRKDGSFSSCIHHGRAPYHQSVQNCRQSPKGQGRR